MQVNFLRGVPADEALVPVANALSEAYRTVLREYGSRLVQYQTPGLTDFLGFRPLKEILAARFNVAGDPEKRIVCSNGGMETFSFLLRSFPAGSLIATDACTYDRVLQDIERQGLLAVGIPFVQDGVDLDCLERRLAAGGISVFYQVGYHHNPLGTTVSLQNLSEAARLCEKYGTLHVVDIAYLELRYDGKTNSLPAMESTGANMAFVGSFTKTLSPGAKCGFGIFPEPILAEMTPVIANSRLNPNYPTQAAIHHLIESDFYDEHLAYLTDLYRPRMQAANQVIAQRFPQSGLPELTGGFFLGLWLPGIKDEGKFVSAVKDKETTISVSKVFAPGMREKYCNTPAKAFFRLTFPPFTPAEITFGVNTIADVYEAFLQAE